MTRFTHRPKKTFLPSTPFHSQSIISKSIKSKSQRTHTTASSLTIHNLKQSRVTPAAASDEQEPLDYICYTCGSKQHALARCPLKTKGTNGLVEFIGRESFSFRHMFLVQATWSLGITVSSVTLRQINVVIGGKHRYRRI